MPAATILYSDLSAYYDLLCADIDYSAQSAAVLRLHQLFGNGGKQYLDLACGTGTHLRYFLDYGFHCTGIDLNPAMLEQAAKRCPDAQFYLHDMAEFQLAEPVDLISCFLYSIHYNANKDKLKQCIENVYHALKPQGIFCFNSVDKSKINNQLNVSHCAQHGEELLHFQSSWFYDGQSEQQTLRLKIEKTCDEDKQVWHDEHTMVACSFSEMQQLLEPYFEVIPLAHDYVKIHTLEEGAGNALFVCIKRN